MSEPGAKHSVNRERVSLLLLERSEHGRPPAAAFDGLRRVTAKLAIKPVRTS